MQSKQSKRSDNYFVKEGYVCNKEILTVDAVSKGVYWDEKRIYSSGVYQYYVYKYVGDIVEKKSLQSLLDVGCGVATKLKFLHKRLPELSITGVDQDSAIQYCKDNYDFGDWHVDDFENPSSTLDDLKVDLIVCSDVIEHLLVPDKLLDYLKSKMSSETLLIISTPERDILRGEDCMDSPNKNHIREWNKEELQEYLEASGFEILDHHLDYPVKIALNRIFVSHFLKWLRRGAFKGRSFKNNQVFLLKKK